jgi:hypothetical protein
MLKIKDNVDLKELKKYGFIFKDALPNICWKPKKGTWEVIEISINLHNRIIDIQGIGDLFHTKEDTLYDLIKANLVEKVGEIDNE